MRTFRGEIISLILIGFAIGCVGSYVYFVDFLEDRAEDGIPVELKGELYEIEKIEDMVNLETNINLSRVNLSRVNLSNLST